MKIYTKKGDNGTTSLIGGTRVEKDDPRVEAYGTIDELMAFTAFLRDGIDAVDAVDSTGPLAPHSNDLLRVLDRLMRITSHLAAEEGNGKNLPSFGAEDTEWLEKRIDEISAGLLPVGAFTLPGGHQLISKCHIARTVCRRAERRIAAMQKQWQVPENIAGFVNRLSDYFYILGRVVAKELNVKDIEWRF